jgi:hypothetical protein
MSLPFDPNEIEFVAVLFLIENLPRAPDKSRIRADNRLVKACLPECAQFYRYPAVNFRKFARSSPHREQQRASCGAVSTGGTMGDFWSDMIERTIETMRFTCEAQGVISARMMLFASGDPNAADEAAQMVAEKILAFTQAGIAAERALSDGLGFAVAADRAYSPLRDCVHANSNRLIDGLH